MSDLVGTFKDIESGDLRVLALIENLHYDVKYIRDDVASVYDANSLDKIYRQIMSGQISSLDLQNFTEIGEFEAQTYFFEEVTIFVFPMSRYDGLFASYDRTNSLPIREILKKGTKAPSLVEDAHGSERAEK